MDNVILTQIPVNELLDKVREVIREEICANVENNNNTHTGAKPITQKELCKFLGITEPTVLRWRKKNKIPFFHIGTAIRFNLSDVLKSLKNEESNDRTRNYKRDKQ